jgi:hypothetical protein
VSQAKFSAITSSLLARKGDAMPSAVAAKPSFFWWRANGHAPDEEPKTPRAKRAAKPPRLLDPSRPHKMVVVVSAAEFEKLGIAAVKQGVTRRQLVRTALDRHLDRLSCEYAGCSCMATGGPCTKACEIF